MAVEVRRWDRRGVGVDDGCNSSRDIAVAAAALSGTDQALIRH